MRTQAICLALVCLLVPSAGTAQNAEIHYAPPPNWVVPMQPRPASSGQQDGLVHFAYSDVQVRTGGAGTESYQAFRARLLRPEALALGNINLVWMPDGGDATAHHLRIIRDGEVIDVLK